jgi:hypothetical protein
LYRVVSRCTVVPRCIAAAEARNRPTINELYKGTRIFYVVSSFRMRDVTQKMRDPLDVRRCVCAGGVFVSACVWALA